MGKLARDFVASENRKYTLKIGQLVASSLSGFIAGIIAASIVWMIALKFIRIIS